MGMWGRLSMDGLSPRLGPVKAIFQTLQAHTMHDAGRNRYYGIGKALILLAFITYTPDGITRQSNFIENSPSPSLFLSTPLSRTLPMAETSQAY